MRHNYKNVYLHVCENMSESFYIELYNNDIDQLKELLSTGADPNKQDKLGNTPLNYVTRTKNMQKNLLIILLLNGADPNITNIHGENSLHVAARHFQIEDVQILLRFGANPYLKDKKGITPARSALLQSWVSTVEIPPVKIAKIINAYFPTFHDIVLTTIGRNKIDVSAVPPTVLDLFN